MSRDETSKQKIVDAATACFAKSGYSKSSIEEIAKCAGVSKALVFHYYKNKQALAQFLVDYYIDMIISNVEKHDYFVETDFFDRLKMLSAIKLEIFRNNQHISDFFVRILSEPNNLIFKNIDVMAKTNLEAFSKGVDFSKFKDGIDSNMVINIVKWIGTGFAKDNADWDRSIDDMNREVYEYLDIVKQGVYKKEYL